MFLDVTPKTFVLLDNLFPLATTTKTVNLKSDNPSGKEVSEMFDYIAKNPFSPVLFVIRGDGNTAGATSGSKGYMTFWVTASSITPDGICEAITSFNWRASVSGSGTVTKTYLNLYRTSSGYTFKLTAS